MNISAENTIIEGEAQHNALTERRLSRSISVKALILLICLAAGFGHMTCLTAANGNDNPEEYLAETGMPVQEIETLDHDLRQFIAEDLRSSGERNWKINKDILTLTKISSERYTVVFYINVYAFQTEHEHRIYAVYESSTGIMPAGNDCLSLRLGDSFVPCEYGGQIWYKKAGDGNWIQGLGLTADDRTLEGGTFTGRQLGDFQRKMLVKGCVYCHAREGRGDDSSVIVDYTYNPPKESNGTGMYILIVVITVIIVLILRKKE